MGALGGVQQQYPGDRVEDLLGHLDVASLFQPCVPGHSDARQHGDLLAPQARRAPSAAVRHACLGRRDPGSTAAQELPELGAAFIAGEGRVGRVGADRGATLSSALVRP
jgi:hypothetical protein